MQDITLTTEKHATISRAMLMAIWIRWYGAEHIAQYGRSRATLNATGLRHRAIIRRILPRQTPSRLVIPVWYGASLGCQKIS